MMQRKTRWGKLGFAAGALSFAAATPTASALEVAAVGSLTQAGPVAGSGVGTSAGGRAGFGGGALVAVPIDEKLSIDVGALYLPRTFAGDGGGGEFTASFSALHVPVLARYTLPNRVSVGVGGYYSRSLGSVTLRGGDGARVTRTHEEFGSKRTDAGAVVSVGYRYPFSPEVGLVADARYLHGLVNMLDGATDGDSRHYRDVQLLAGVGYSF